MKRDARRDREEERKYEGRSSAIFFRVGYYEFENIGLKLLLVWKALFSMTNEALGQELRLLQSIVLAHYQMTHNGNEA